jgi:hypothetical protein
VNQISQVRYRSLLLYNDQAGQARHFAEEGTEDFSDKRPEKAVWISFFSIKPGNSKEEEASRHKQKCFKNPGACGAG